MSSTDRQNRLLLAEDWKRIYQSFRFAEFKSYDFDTLRRTMISYLRTNYPEDFNDYIESSEYLALIDMIAFLGQNLSFRVDLNARENFIELAERRESVLRLARLLSYNPTRNRAANGLLKIVSVSTTENVIDSNDLNLSGRTIVWNDSINVDWFEQYVKIINAAMPNQNTFGKPVKRALVAGIPTEQYNFSNEATGIPIYAFSKSINNRSLDFEIVSCTIDGDDIREQEPLPGSPFTMLYRDNGRGAGNNSTGFFVHFRQGTMQRGDFAVNLPVPNQKIDIDVADINHTDVWLYSLDSNNNEYELWNKVDAVEGNNIVYNSLNKKIKNIYSVLTRTDDRVSLIFSDGVFGNLPQGAFRVYYRTSANRDYTILPANISNVSIRIPYVSANGRVETLTLTCELTQAVDNASSTESTISIRENAPSTYYTQNRLITGEDYNVGPLGISQDIIKVKSVNRTSSGISRYYDILDATGKYSNTNLFGKDGILYKEYVENKTTFDFVTRTDIQQVIENQITDILEEKNLTNFYLDKFPNQRYEELNLTWNANSIDTNRTTGYLQDSNNIRYAVGTYTEGPLRFFEPGSLVRFIPPEGYYFDENGDLTAGSANSLGARTYLWTKVISVSGAGTDEISTNIGPILFNDKIPTGSKLDVVKPKFVRDILADVKIQMIDQIFAYRTFGLRYDREFRNWLIIEQDNLKIDGDFSLGLSGDFSNQQLDSSWILLFETNGETYDLTYRTLRYVFESDKEIRFYHDSNKKIYDSNTGQLVKDKLTVLNINNDVNATPNTAALTIDFDWEISKEYRDTNGYIDSKKVEVSFYDSDDDGVIDDPQIFEKIVNLSNYIFQKKITMSGETFYSYIDKAIENIIVVNNFVDINVQVENNPIYYIKNTDTFFQLTSATRQITQIYNYRAFIGRDKIKFQYIHATDENSRIDPSSSNIIDVYILTRQYDVNFRAWVTGVVSTKPLPPSSDSLYRSYGGEINKVKSISDELIYHPVKYKPLFGNKSDLDMQATIKVVKNKERVVNDNDLKSRIIDNINIFFSLDNWEFGETFYWSELSAFIMRQMSPDIQSIVIVPKLGTSFYGSLQEIKAEPDEIFISSASVGDIEIISSITAERLKAEGAIVTSTSSTNSGIQSSTVIVNNNLTGGTSY